MYRETEIHVLFQQACDLRDSNDDDCCTEEGKDNTLCQVQHQQPADDATHRCNSSNTSDQFVVPDNMHEKNEVTQIETEELGGMNCHLQNSKMPLKTKSSRSESCDWNIEEPHETKECQNNDGFIPYNNIENKNNAKETNKDECNEPNDLIGHDKETINNNGYESETNNIDASNPERGLGIENLAFLSDPSTKDTTPIVNI